MSFKQLHSRLAMQSHENFKWTNSINLIEFQWNRIASRIEISPKISAIFSLSFAFFHGKIRSLSLKSVHCRYFAVIWFAKIAIEMEYFTCRNISLEQKPISLRKRVPFPPHKVKHLLKNVIFRSNKYFSFCKFSCQKKKRLNFIQEIVVFSMLKSQSFSHAFLSHENSFVSPILCWSYLKSTQNW